MRAPGLIHPRQGTTFPPGEGPFWHLTPQGRDRGGTAELARTGNLVATLVFVVCEDYVAGDQLLIQARPDPWKASS